MGSGVCQVCRIKLLYSVRQQKRVKRHDWVVSLFSVLSWLDGHFMFLLHEYFHRSATTFHDVNALLWSVKATALHIVILSCGVV